MSTAMTMDTVTTTVIVTDHGHSHDHEHNHDHSDEQNSAVDVHTEDTPNPNARKYVISGATISESFSAAAGAQTDHALAKALVAIEGVSLCLALMILLPSPKQKTLTGKT